MAELIIGHTTHNSTLLWVRGDKRLSLVQVLLKLHPNDPAIPSDPLTLGREDDYIAVVSFEKLKPSTHYRVVAEFAPSAAVLARRPTAIAGHFSTFPEPTLTGSRFTFLLGSCNLSTARLTSLGALLASALGTLAMSESAKRDSSSWVWPRPGHDASVRTSGRWWLRWIKRFFSRVLSRVGWRVLRICPRLLKFGARWGAWTVWAALLQLTRFQQPIPRLRSPFVPLLESLDGSGERPAFMIHAGDQIYFDIDAPSRPPDVEEYRRAYRQAWFEDSTTRTLLASCPHYMILDDHEIIDSFANEPSLQKHRDAGTRAYTEYVHRRHPGTCENALFYQFDYDHARFFVLDTRTERCPDREQMISCDQLLDLATWLRNNRDRLKFIVSSVPFVAQLRPPSNGGDAGAKDERDDKWCGETFRAQRDAIIDLIYAEKIPRVVFLVGDMHCTYHATMRVGPPKDRVAIYEIAAGPINQVEFAGRGQFYDHYRDTTRGGNPFSSLLRSFHGSTAAAVRVTVEPHPSPIVSWSVVPTSRPTTAPTETPDRKTPTDAPSGYQPPPLRGYISFPEIRP